MPKTPKEFRVNHFVPLVRKDSCVTITPVNLSCNAASETPISEKSSERQFGDISELEVSPGLQSATGKEDDVSLDRYYPMPVSSISSECYKLKDILEHLPSQDSSWEVFDADDVLWVTVQSHGLPSKARGRALLRIDKCEYVSHLKFC